MKSTSLGVLTASLATVIATSVASRNRGIYSSNMTRSTPSCGQCHAGSPGAAAGFPKLAVSLAPTRRSLTPGQSISVTTAATGGQTRSSMGGFAMDATRGTFSAGAGTRTHASGAGVTHSSPGPRRWTVGYTAPSQPGLVELRSVVNTVDGDGKRDSDDMWAFHGADSTSRTATPVRLFVNAPGVVPLGQGCAGSFGNWPVLGAQSAPVVGNGAFGFELHGAAPQATFAFIIGVDPNRRPIDLTAIGITGCTLFVDTAVTLASRTGGGSAQRGEGTATIALPIPQNPWLVGKTLRCQAAIIDPQNGRRIPVTMTNALSWTFR